MKNPGQGACLFPHQTQARPAWLARSWRHCMLPAVVLAALTLFSDTLPAKEAWQLKSGVVSRVVDGDTVWVKAGSEILKVRISGIDAPEICQTDGIPAREALRQRALGQWITLVYQRHDDYGRLLARVELQGEDLGRWMVSQGHAWSYAWRNNAGPYAHEQAQAIAARRGLFAVTGAENPRSFRKRHGSCFP